MKKVITLSAILCCFLVTSAGCSNTHGDATTISVNPDSEYVNTFNDLHLGLLFDFNFRLPHADDRWVKLWVERYQDGKKDPKPLTQLSYGESPNEMEEGNIGFGIINPNQKDTSVFLYAPNIVNKPVITENKTKETMTTWQYGISEDEVTLEVGETKILAAYHGADHSTRTWDLQDTESVNKMIQQDSLVMLLKIKIEEKPTEAS